MSFTLYSPSMNKLNYPDGLKPLDFLISSIEKERIEESIDGIPGSIDYGFNYKSREITLTFWIKYKHGEHDYHLQKNEINHMLDQFEYFYISNDNVPSRMMRITIDEAYMPERIQMSNFAKLEVSARVSGLPFWRTKYTTQDIQNTGYSSLVEQYGLADGIHIDYPNYTYTVDEFYIWNGGNVEIDPRNMPLKITIEGVTSPGNFSIESFTNGDKFIYKEPLNNQTLTLDGTKVLVGVNNKLRDSNRKFLRINLKRNTLKIKNGTFSKVKVEFPFYYK